jgi:hypothetical protein
MSGIDSSLRSHDAIAYALFLIDETVSALSNLKAATSLAECDRYRGLNRVLAVAISTAGDLRERRLRSASIAYRCTEPAGAGARFIPAFSKLHQRDE